MTNKKQITPRQKRCEDCTNLKKIGSKWTCEECFEQLCNDIDDCPMGITIEQTDEIDKMSKEVKINIRARSETTKERKPREKKPDDVKEWLITMLADKLENNHDSDPFSRMNVLIINSTQKIEFDIGDEHFKLTLSRQRKPKN